LELNTGATTRGWGPPLVRRLGPEIGQPGLESDFPWFGVDVLVMRRHAPPSCVATRGSRT
jgi:hypothetical protein